LDRYILNFLRDGNIAIPEDKALEQQLYAEIDFFQLSDMLSHLQEGKATGFTFSSMHKHSAIQLSHLSTCEHTAWHVNWASVLVRPALRTSSITTIRFRVDSFDIFNAVQIGIFLKIPKSYQDTPSVAFNPEGDIVGTAKFELLENTKQHYKEGDIIGVVANMVAWNVEFWRNNKKVALVKVPGMSKSEEVHFGVSMWWRNKVSLVLEE